MAFDRLLAEVEGHSHFGDTISEIRRLMIDIFNNRPPNGMQILDTENAYFNDHGQGHTSRIIKKISDLNRIMPSEFTELESFLLISSAWLHDIGMYIGRRKGETIFQVRERHAKISADIVYELSSTYYPSLTNPELVLLQQIIIAHSSNYDINTVSTEPDSIEGDIARKALLCAVFRIADACDCTHSRAPESVFYIYYDFIPESSKEHWEKLFSVTDVSFDAIRSAIIISYDFGNNTRDLIEKYILSNILKSEIERELSSVHNIFLNNSVPITRVLIKYFGRNEYLDFTSFNKEQYCLITLRSNFRLFNDLMGVLTNYLEDEGELSVILEIRPPEGPLYINTEKYIAFDRTEEMKDKLRSSLGEFLLDIDIIKPVRQVIEI